MQKTKVVIPEVMKKHSHKGMATDGKHCKSVRAWAVAMVHNGGIVEAGRVVGHWSDNPNGAVCTVTVWAWHGPLDGLAQTGKAGGGGYCKFSAAFASAIRNAGIEAGEDLSGRGEGAVKSWLESLGYVVLRALG